jgi:hypothetical protein
MPDLGVSRNDTEYPRMIIPPFQIIRHFGFSRYVVFAMYLDKCISKCMAKATYLEKPKCLIVWNGGSILFFPFVDLFVHQLVQGE